MNKSSTRILWFLAILAIYIAVLAVLGRVLPIVFLVALLALFLIRRPISHPERLESDIRAFARKVGKAAGKLAEMLIRPLMQKK